MWFNVLNNALKNKHLNLGKVKDNSLSQIVMQHMDGISEFV